MRIFKQDEIKEAADLLRRGAVIAFPTETVYGLGASIFQQQAIERIYRVKGRPSDNPLIVHISDISQVEHVATNIPDSFYCLARQFWPGPLTFILKRNPSVPDTFSVGLDTIAVRVPAHPVARQLLLDLAEPIAAPSANLSGRPSSTTVDHVVDDFEGLIDGVVEGLPADIGLESTVLNLLENPPVLLRPGSISKEELERVLGEPVRLKAVDDKVVAPGMKYRHYAPKIPIFLVYTQKELEGMNLSRALVLCREEIALSSSIRRAALHPKSLYALFRQAEHIDIDAVIVFCDPWVQGQAALMNRLLHAAQKLS